MRLRLKTLMQTDAGIKRIFENGCYVVQLTLPFVARDPDQADAGHD